MPAIPDEAFFTLAPDWVCEVLSPSTERIDRGRKLRIYARGGRRARLARQSRSTRTLEVLRLRDGAWTIVGVWEGAAVVRAEPFDGVALELASAAGGPATVTCEHSRRKVLDRRRRSDAGSEAGEAAMTHSTLGVRR